MVETYYRGPEVETEVVVGGRSIRLVRPAEPDRLLEDPEVEELNARDDYMPYWAYLWPGAFLLAEAVARSDGFGEGEVLEIGCGLGLVGLTALARGAAVRFTDYDAAPLGFVERSARANGFNRRRYRVQRLDWRDLPEERFSCILGADVLYERRLVPLVANLIARLLDPDGFALLAGPYRVATLDLEPCLDRYGLRFESESVQAQSTELGPVRGTLYRVWRGPTTSISE